MSDGTVKATIGTLVDHYVETVMGAGRSTDLYDLVIGAAERPLIVAVLRAHVWNQTRTAVALGINRNTLAKKMKQHGILREVP